MSFANVLSQFKKSKRKTRSSTSSSVDSDINNSELTTSLSIVAKNSMAWPIMMRDMNVMKQGILKLVKIAGDTQRDKADRFFLSSSEREKSYETQIASTKSIKSTSPTKVGEKKEGKGFFGQSNDFLNSMIAGGLTNLLIKGGIIATILYGIGKFFTSAEFRTGVFDMINNLGKAVFGEEAFADIKKNITYGSLILLGGIVAIKAAMASFSAGLIILATKLFSLGGGPSINPTGPVGPKSKNPIMKVLKGVGLVGAGLGLYNMFTGGNATADANGNGEETPTTTPPVSPSGLGGVAAAGTALAVGSAMNRVSTPTTTPTAPTEQYRDPKTGRFTKAPTTKWARFLSFLEKNDSKLFNKVGKRLLIAGAGLAIPGPGWIWTAISVLGSVSLAWELYGWWQQFTGQSDKASSNSPEKVTTDGNEKPEGNEEQEKDSLISRLMNDSGGIRIDANVTPDYYKMMGVTPPTSSRSPSRPSVASPSPVSSPSMRSNYSGGGDEIDRVLNSIKGVESGGGDYNAKNPNSSASGAYQFIDSTWQASTKKYGIGQQYPTARSAPPEIQDAVARKSVEELMAKYNGDTDKVANVWYTGNPNGNMTAAGLAANRGFTSEKYRAKFQSFQNNSGGSLNQTSNAMLNSRNAPSSSPVVFAPNTTNNNVGGSQGGTINLPSSGVNDNNLSKLMVERAIG